MVGILAFVKKARKHPKTENKQQKKTLSLGKDALYVKIYTVCSVLLNLLLIIDQAYFPLPSYGFHDLFMLLPTFPFM